MGNLKDSNVDMQRKYRPFINIWEHRSQDFKNLIRMLMTLIRQGDDSTSQSSGELSLRRFENLLNGWKKAQKIIADELITRLSLIEQLEKDKRLAHAEKKYDMKQKCILDVMKNKSEINILRR